MRAREVNKAIEKRGGTIVRQKGSHRMYAASTDTGTSRTVVPQHAKDIPIGTLRSIEKDMEPAFGKGWLTK